MRVSLKDLKKKKAAEKPPRCCGKTMTVRVDPACSLKNLRWERVCLTCGKKESVKL